MGVMAIINVGIAEEGVVIASPTLWMTGYPTGYSKYITIMTYCNNYVEQRCCKVVRNMRGQATGCDDCYIPSWSKRCHGNKHIPQHVTVRML